jgi:hypothetical protein
VVKSIAQSSSFPKTNTRWCSILKLVAREIPKEDRQEWRILKWSEGGEKYGVLEGERGKNDGKF